MTGSRAEQRDRPGQDLLRGAVVHGEAPAAAAHLDAEAGQGDPVVVDALVRVSGDEHVVGSRRHGGAQQPPLGRVEVLGLVHDHVPVQGLAGVAQQVGGLVGELDVGGAGQRRREFCGDAFGGAQTWAALGLAERSAPAGAQAGQVGLLGVQVLREDDLFPLVLEETSE